MKLLLFTSTTLLLLQLTSCGAGHEVCNDNDNINMACNTFFGEDVENGEDGVDGQDGELCTVKEVTNGSLIICGSNNVFIADGTNGSNGSDGSNGSNGSDGVDGNDGSNGSNGSNGTDGADATLNPHSITDIIDPCGDNAGRFDEVLLKTYDGRYLAYFEEKGKRFLTVLDYGQDYKTTDKQACDFRIDANGDFSEI